MKNKQQACIFLGEKNKPLSERSIERYVKAGKLNVTHIKEPGKSRDTPMFDETELKALKHEMQNPPPAATTTTALTRATSAALPQLLASPDSQASFDRFAETIGKAVAFALDHAAPRIARPSLFAMTGKLTLSRDELIERTGLPWTVLLAAIRAGELRGQRVTGGAKQTGGRWNFKCDDVDAYIETR